MQIRKDSLENNHYYHVYSRSIAKFVVFNDATEFERMYDLMKFYRFDNLNHRLSQFLDLDLSTQTALMERLEKENDVLAEIVAYCIMPTHVHLLLKQKMENGISKYLGKVLNGYSRFFNEKHRRSGPLWSGRFKSVLVATDEQLLHLTRYIHLNPTSANLIKKLEDWEYTSYHEYIDDKESQECLCKFQDLIEIPSKEYKKFVEARQSYQRDLSKIKHLLIEDYTG